MVTWHGIGQIGSFHEQELLTNCGSSGWAAGKGMTSRYHDGGLRLDCGPAFIRCLWAMELNKCGLFSLIASHRHFTRFA